MRSEAPAEDGSGIDKSRLAMRRRPKLIRYFFFSSGYFTPRPTAGWYYVVLNALTMVDLLDRSSLVNELESRSSGRRLGRPQNGLLRMVAA